MLNQIIHILQLPERCLVNKRITKAFFKRNFDMTSSEKNLLDDYNTITAIDWIASISMANANVPEYKDCETTFEEIQVIAVTTSPQSLKINASKIIDLIQKYIPYHMLLIVHDGINSNWNVTYKHINQNDNNKRTLGKKFTADWNTTNSNNKLHEAFCEALSFSRVPSTNLRILYEGYVQCFIGLITAPIIGSFEIRPAERTKEDVERLERITSLEKEINTLTNVAQKETQLNKRIEINTQVQQKRKQIKLLKNSILNA
ncbi:MAG: DUF4391 domain-containing protein [Bacteroidota bacterium]|nr:DUF4391 domain-containing protein [Bacteroidota bacterium]